MPHRHEKPSWPFHIAECVARDAARELEAQDRKWRSKLSDLEREHKLDVALVAARVGSSRRAAPQGLYSSVTPRLLL